MKKILGLGLLLAVVAAVALPAVAFAETTDDTTATGEMVGASISITAPASQGLDFGVFVPGANNVNSAGDNGAVTVTPGSNGNDDWVVTAVSAPAYGGRMFTSNGGGVFLTDKLWISKDGSSWYFADGSTGSLTYTGSGSATGCLPLYAQQTIESTDTTTGVYDITITFSASLTGF